MRKSWHNADIVAAVKKAGTSLAKLAEANGFRASTFRAALHRRHPKAQLIIAKAIGRSRHELWPNWYGRDDRLLPLTPFQRRALARSERSAA